MEGKRPRSSLHYLGHFLNRLLNRSEGQVVVLEPKRVRLMCLEARLEVPPVRSVMLMSGTLDRSLIEELGLEAGFLNLSSYASYHSKVFLLEDVTTKFEERSGEVFRAYARYVKLLASLPINIAVFAASYEVLKKDL